MNHSEFLIQITIIFLLAFANACLTWFYSFCLGDPHKGDPKSGRIFSGLGFWLNMKYEETELKINKTFAKHEHQIKQSGLRDQDYVHAITAANIARKKNIYKALGICPMCSNIWFGFITGGLTLYIWSLSWFLYIPYLVVSNAFLRFMVKNG